MCGHINIPIIAVSELARSRDPQKKDLGGPPTPLQTQINGFQRFSGAARRPLEKFVLFSFFASFL